MSSLLKRLHTADHPEAMEAPPDFNWRGAMAEVRALQPQLEAILGQSLELDDQVQDASFFAELTVRKPDALRREILTLFAVRFSAFGRLFTVWSYCPPELRPSEEVINQIIQTIEQAGYVYVDETTLKQPYSGIHPYFAGMNWYNRFFEYI